jgi:exodeoxyribonuclease V alpha subunit
LGDPPKHRNRQALLQELQQATTERVEIEGVVERIVYESADTGFVVARLSREGQVDLTTFVGPGLAVSPGETVRLAGHWVDDAKFGRQLKVDGFETIRPSTAAAIEKYLGSGLIEGVGKVYAKRLVDAFGVDTLRVIDEEPQRLRGVDGIGRKRADQVRTAWEAQKAIQAIMLFLQGHGIPTTQAVRIYKQYGDKAVAVLRDNPYRLARDIAGIGFKSADRIAEQLGIARDSDRRAAAGVLHMLQEASGGGHVLLPKDELVERSAELLGVNKDRVLDAIDPLEKARDIVCEGDDVYLPLLYESETATAELLKRLMGIPLTAVPIKVEKAIEWIEQRQSFPLSVEQREAVRQGVTAKVLVITGGPGTGKTTVLNGLLDVLEAKGVDAALAAPTGRAAKRMTEATGRSALTLHRLLEFSPKQGGFTRNEANPIDEALVVVDESSMIDIALMHALVRALPPHARLILVGDVDQLPSVGPGNVLMDVLASQAVPAVWLKTVFRQAEQSGIITNAHAINHGEEPRYNTVDFFFVERDEGVKAREAIVEMVANRIPKKFGLNPMRDVQVLAPMHRGDAGVSALNEALQTALNPKGKPVPRRPFGVGDKVMQMRNDYERDVYNGDIGVVTSVDDGAKEAVVRFDVRDVMYGYDDTDSLALAYASTVHKAQGSEYPAIVMALMPQHYMMLQRNVFYTAITRARQLVVLVGDPKAVGMAIRNTDGSRRYSRLAERLRNAAG